MMASPKGRPRNPVECYLVFGWKAIARYLGVHEDTARTYMKAKGMPVRYTLSGRPFIEPREIIKWFITCDDRKKNGSI